MNTQRLTPARIDALIASSYNLHVGPKVRGEAMTPAKAAELPKSMRLALCWELADKGGSDLYSKLDAHNAAAILQGFTPYSERN